MTAAEKREQLRLTYTAGVCDALRQYILAGYPFHLETLAESDSGEVHVTFALGDAERFTQFLEPDAASVGDGSN